MNDEIKLVFEQLGKVLGRLQEAADETPTEKRIVIDATIQRFEFTVELFWKALKKHLKQDFGIEVYGPKKVLEQAYVNSLIDNEQLWIDMLEDRNMTSHTYKEDLADEIYIRIKKYVPEMKATYDKLIKQFG